MPSLPGDFFDPGVTERFGEDGDGDSGDEGKAVRVGTGEAGANSKASAGGIYAHVNDDKYQITETLDR